jgi:hypothetical protein
MGWVAMGALAVALLALGTALMDQSPFSSFPFWLPFFEETGGLVRGATDPALFWRTGCAFTVAALLLALGSAAFLRRWPERYLRSRTLALGAATMVGASIAASAVAPGWLSTVRPAGDRGLYNRALLRGHHATLKGRKIGHLAQLYVPLLMRAYISHAASANEGVRRGSGVQEHRCAGDHHLVAPRPAVISRSSP